MKRTVSLRIQIFGLMALLVILQSLSLMSSLWISRVFPTLDAEAFRLFDSTMVSRTQTHNASVGALVESVAGEAERLSHTLQARARAADMSPHDLYRSDSAYLDAAQSATQSLFTLLRGNTVSGAFVFLNGSNAHKGADGSHSALYIRNAAPSNISIETSNYLLEVGPSAIAQQYQVPISVNWKLDVPLLAGGSRRAAFYAQPMWAATEYPGSEYLRYGYWSPPADLLGDGQQVVAYTMPLLDENGAPFGIVGVEISLSTYSQFYLPNIDLPYENSFYAIAMAEDNALDLRWLIPSGPLAQVYLGQQDTLPLTPVPDSDLSSVHLEGLGDMYCAIQTLTVYSRNSPFYGESWSLLGFVPQTVLHETSAQARVLLLASIGLTTLICFAAIFLLTYVTTRKISGLSRYVQGLSPYMDIHFRATGIREIDELTAAVEMLNKSAVSASKTTSKILNLSLLPIGGFEIGEGNTVVLTEFIYSLLHLEPGTHITGEAWAELYRALTAYPEPGYGDTYRYRDQQDGEHWLRILTAPSEDGSGSTVGVIVDVTKDIQEHRRLAHELDYDALTNLFSRSAFKRRSYSLIAGAPSLYGAMIFVDLDNLKYMNDTFGHDMGDRLIIRAAEIFRAFEQYGAVVSRISGDEFAIYLHGYETKESLREIIYRQFAQSRDTLVHTPDGQSQRVRFSTGIAFYPDDATDATDLLKLSDYAMYEAKHNQKGSVFEFSRESYHENAYLLDNSEAINRLLDDGLIRFALQPIVDVKTGEIYGFEALMRPLLDNFKSPLEILAVAASQSKLGQLERLVLLTGMQYVLDNQPILENRKVFLNSIPSEVLSGEDTLYMVREFSCIFDHVVVEITEAENNQPEKLTVKCGFLHEHGIPIAIDDFGSGYSNEIRILSMSPDIVKVDIEMIRDIDKSHDRQQLAANLIAFCHPRGIRLVAEGVETSAELAEVIRLGFDYVQGYYLARPSFDPIPSLPQPLRDEILRHGKDAE